MSPVAGPQTAKHIFGQPAAPNLNVHLLCPNCKEDPPNLVEEYAKGDIVCGSCGMVLGDRIVDTRSEWRTFAGDENGDDPSRVGDSSNPLLKETFDTQISSHDGGKGIARDLQRAANRQVHGPGNKSNALLSAAFSKLNEKAEMMQLPRAVVLQAQQIYSIGFEQNLIRGKDTDAAIGACIILGCRSAKVDRTLLEVANLVKVNKKKIGQALLALNPVVNKTRAGSGHLTTINNAEQQIQNIVARVVNYLGQPHEVQKAANHIAGAAADMEGVAGRSPVSIAAGILWFACLLYERDRADPPVTAKRISELAKVSDSTIKFICKKISTKIEQVIKPEWASLSGYEALAALGRTEVVGNSNKPSRAGSRAATPKDEVPGSPKSPKSDTSASAKDEKS